jgi:protein gp37
MGENTGISWANSTFNPWVGCTKVGPGCDGCYAEATDARFKGGHWGVGAPRRRTSEANWKQPRAWNKRIRIGDRRRVFGGSMCDPFDNEIPDEWRADYWALIRETPNLDWLLVTKRIGNAAKMLPPDWGDGYPNVWLLATIVNQPEADRDMGKLVDLPARIRGVSVEPMLGPLNILPWADKLDWVICGGESAQRGHGARSMSLEWAIDLAEQCKRAGVFFHMKQLSQADFPDTFEDFETFPEAIRIREYPGQAA